MNEITRLAIICVLVFIINIPFGYWRAGVKKFSAPWFLAIHLPIPFVIALRLSFNLGFQLYTFPFVIVSFFLGQFFGSKIRNRNKRKELNN